MSSVGRAASLAIVERVVTFRAPLVRVGDEKLFGGEESNYPATRVGDHHLLLDPRRRMAIRGGAIGLQREDHPLLDLQRFIERDEPADDRPLVQSQAQPMAEL